MTLDSLDDVIPLRNYRRKMLAMKLAAESGYINCELIYGGEKYDPGGMIPLDSIRAAYVKAFDDFLVSNEQELRALGVSLTPAQGQEGK